jgi:hypothetical protein
MRIVLVVERSRLVAAAGVAGFKWRLLSVSLP